MNHLLLWGNAYCLIHRNGGARVQALELLDPNDVKVVVNDQDGLTYYECKTGTYNAAEILHIVGFSFDGIIGKSPIKACREALGLGLAAQKFGENFFGRGANLSGVLTHPGRLTEDAANRLRGSWSDRFGGIHNSHQTAILEEGVEFKPIGMPLDDAQFIETRRFSVEEVARIFRVPPHLIGDLTRSTYSNIEQQSLEFTKYSLQPYLVNIEQELNKKLLPEKDQSKYYLKFRTAELLRADANSRSDYYRKMFEVGALSPNEIRNMEDMNKIENGDEHFVPLNLGVVGKEKTNEIENEKTEPEPEPEPNREDESGE
jgi:HK97 family phage portal protein